MACRSPINGRKRDWAATRGFTLLELMLVTVISAIVFGGVLSAYIFLGRSLTRQGNEAQQESRSRMTLFYLTHEVSSATGIAPDSSPPATTSGASQMVLNTVDGDGNPYSVTYAYNAGSGTLTRSSSAGTGPTSLLTGVTGFTFTYYNSAGSAVTTPLNPSVMNPNVVKQVNVAFTTVAGAAVSGAQSTFTVVSPLIVMKNKPLLQ